MLFLVAALGGVLSVLQPITDPATLASTVLDPTLFAVAIFLALRAGSGITSLVESGVMQVYLAYPVSRRGAALILWVSRVAMPSLILIATPVIVASLILYPVVAGDPGRLLAGIAGYEAQALLYGTVFALIAVKSRSSGTASLLSIAFYFSYTVAGVILIILSTTLGAPTFGHLGKAILYYRTMLDYLVAVEVTAWQLAFTPTLLVVLLIIYIIYYTRRFEA